jgi:hypothetical protein
MGLVFLPKLLVPLSEGMLVALHKTIDIFDNIGGLEGMKNTATKRALTYQD